MLRLDGSSVDPSRAAPPPAVLANPSERVADRPILYLLQLEETPSQETIASVHESGLAVLQHVPEGLFLAWGTPSAALRARALRSVAWVGPFPTVLKLHPELRRPAVSAAKTTPDQANLDGLPAKLHDVIVQLFEAGDSKDLRKLLARAGGREVSLSRLKNRTHIRALVPATLLAPLARWPSVFRIEPFPKLELYGEREAMIVSGVFPLEASCVEPGYQAWLEKKGLSGAGTLVHMMDDGIEQGNASGIGGTAHPEILGHITSVDNATSDPEADCRSGHGSFNAGLLLGQGEAGGVDARGFLRGQGIAPGASVFATKIFNNAGRFEIGMSSFAALVEKASRRGALISSNSWGASVFGEYNALAAEFDALVRDSDSEPGDQPMAIIFAAGNEGDDTEGGIQSMGSPATAKNVISVGAAENCLGEGRDGCGATQEHADSVRDIPQFSSRGPHADGRLGPTLVAPGTQVAGIASSAQGYDGSGICDPFWPEGQVLYARSSGTSHACPPVAGAAALFDEAYLARTGEAPSPALVRAALVAAARDIAGGEDGYGGLVPNIPNSISGWGLLSMEGLVPDRNAAPAALYFDKEPRLDDTGDVWEILVFPADPARPVKVILAWSDPPAVPGADPVLVNDIDLEVTSEEQLFLGNVLQGGVSVPGGQPNRRDNLECVLLADPGPVLRVRVRAASIAGDGATAGDGMDQDFALVVQGGTLQSSRGAITLRRGAYTCDARVELTVSDLDLKGAGTVQVAIESSAAQQALPVVLTETKPGSGTFDGAVELGKNGGQLHVEHGATITARYADANDGTGVPAESIATASIDCEPPVVSDLSAVEITESSAVVKWITVEDSTGSVDYGAGCATATMVAPSGRRSRTHSVKLKDLPEGSTVFFTLTVADAVGNGVAADNGGACFFFHTSSFVCRFTDDLEPEPAPGWSHATDVGPDDWAPAIFRGARSPTHSWHATAHDGFKDSSLSFPSLALFEGDRLSFWHTFQLENGYDGAVLEISTNAGATWSDLGPFITRGSYVDVISGNPLGDRLAWTGQRPEAMTAVDVDLGSFAGTTSRIRFRIASDGSLVDGFGWHIDDIALCRTLNKRAELRLDRSVYRCGDRIHVMVNDVDLVGAGSAEALASSTSHPENVLIALQELPPGGGVFLGELAIDGSPGALAVSHGDEIVLSYADADTGLWTGPHAALATARVDCVAPQLSELRIEELLDDEATIAWETDEPSIGEVAWGGSCDMLSRLESAPGGISHVVTLSGLDPAAPVSWKVTARDEAGNTTIEDGGGQCRSFRPAAIHSLRFDFDDGSPGWAHLAAFGKDLWQLAAPEFARSAPNTWFLPGVDELSDVSLVSPVFSVPTGSYLAFWHTFEFEESFDGGVIEISADGGQTWTDLGPSIRRGGYNGTLVEPNPISGRRAWTGGTVGPMTRVVIDLAAWADAFAQVRFRATGDASVAGQGWYVDRLEVCQLVREQAMLGLDRVSYPCGGRVGIRVLDTGLIGRESATVEVTSTTETTPELVTLSESSPDTGAFEGTLDLAATDAPGMLHVLPGNEVRVAYVDEDDGTGASRSVVATARVDCNAPLISAAAVVELGTDFAVIAWQTDEEAFGQVDLGSSCGDFSRSVAPSMPTASHSVLVDDLSPGTRYFARVLSRDRAGNTATFDVEGRCIAFRTPVSFCPLEDDLEPGAQSGWDDGGRWEVSESDLAHSQRHLWLTGSGGSPADSSLTSPAFSIVAGAVLELWHTFEAADGFTGGVLEGSADGGETWSDLEEGILEGGYTGFLLAGSPLMGRRAWTGGQLGVMTRVRVSLDALGDGEILVRFRWAGSAGAPQGIWMIDDVQACFTTGETGFAAFSSGVYRCGVLGGVLVADADLTGVGAVDLAVKSSRQPAPLTVSASEVHPGFFQGAFQLSNLEAPGVVHALDGDTLTVTYQDSHDAAGQPLAVVATAAIDCIAPRIQNVRLGAARFSSVTILWETDEPARAGIAYGTTCETLDRTASFGSLTLAHEALLEGLQPEISAQLKITATDAAGNAAVSPRCITVFVHRTCDFEDTLEPPRAGWRHDAAVGTDDWNLVEFGQSRSLPHSFHVPNGGAQKDSSLYLPPVEVPPGAVMTFWHTFALEDGFDGAIIEVSPDGGVSWRDLAPEVFEGGYNGTFAVPSGAIAGWTGGSIDVMTRVSASLDKFAGPGTQIRFRVLCDGSVGSAGWFIDDLSICTFAPGSSQPRFARGNCNGDAGINISDAVFLLNHLFLGGPGPSCRRACDNDASDTLNITDGIYLLNYLFQGGRPIPPPAECDFDFNEGTLTCEGESCVEG